MGKSNPSLEVIKSTDNKLTKKQKKPSKKPLKLNDGLSGDIELQDFK